MMRCEHFLGNHNEEVTKKVLNPRVATILRHVFKEDAVLFKDKVNFKPPGARSDLLHQDQAAGWSKYSSYFLNVVVCIDENTAENGAVSFRDDPNHRLELQGP